MTLYMAVTSDKYEFPFAVAETVPELAKICGVKPQAIRDSMSRVKRGLCKKTRYIKVEVADDD